MGDIEANAALTHLSDLRAQALSPLGDFGSGLVNDGQPGGEHDLPPVVGPQLNFPL
jgi:hypothetical protein